MSDEPFSRTKAEWKKTADAYKNFNSKQFKFEGRCPHCHTNTTFYMNVTSAFRLAGPAQLLKTVLNPKMAVASLLGQYVTKTIGVAAFCDKCDEAGIKCPKCSTITEYTYPASKCAGCSISLVSL